MTAPRYRAITVPGRLPIVELVMPLANSYTMPATIQNTYDIARGLIARSINGAFVECGVGSGGQVAAMGLASIHSGTWRELWAIDSFQGIPLAGPRDDQQPGIGDLAPDRPILSEDQRLVSSGVASVSQSDVRGNLSRWGVDHSRVHFVEGWFEHTVEGASKDIGPIAMLRLDGDLYSSTKVCLDHLFDLVVPGGAVVVDDYGLLGCFDATNEFLKIRGINPTLYEIESHRGCVWFFR